MHPVTAAPDTHIADVQTVLLRVPLGAGRGGSGATEVAVALTTLTDSDGQTGTGFTYALTGGAEAPRALLDGLFASKTRGVRLSLWERTWHELWGLTHRLGRGVALPALSALDIAVWDLRARRAGLPLFRLLGAARDRVPVYGSGRATHAMSTDELIAGARAYLAEGYTAIKLRAGQRPLEEDAERVAAVRAAVGDGVRIMVDCNERLDYASALWLARRLERLGVFWLEEPLPSDDVAGHARLAAQSGIAIAVGEHLLGRFEFAEYLRQGAASILQPDAPLMGGVGEWLRVATLAEGFGATVSPHFLPELHVHLAAAARSCTSIEHFPLIDDLLAETLVAQGGYMTPPERPGHGLLWKADAIERFRVAWPRARSRPASWL